MWSLEQLNCFVTAAETGSFSAASRKLGKAQSAVSMAISNLEIDLNLELFQRSGRTPVLTEAGKALLETARSVLLSQQEFTAHAASLGEEDETALCIAVEQNISALPLLPLLEAFAERFPYVTVELLDPGSGDVAELVRSHRAHIGLMIEQEHYPMGFHFRGIGHSQVVAVAHPGYPLAQKSGVDLADLRQHRQLIGRSLDPENRSHERYMLSPRVWLAESPFAILDLLTAGIGWAYLHQAVVEEKLRAGDLVELDLQYQQADLLQGIDLVWADSRPLGRAGQWMLQQLQRLEYRPGLGRSV